MKSHALNINIKESRELIKRTIYFKLTWRWQTVFDAGWSLVNHLVVSSKASSHFTINTSSHFIVIDEMRYEVLVLYFYLRIILFVDSADSAKYAYQKSAGDSKHFDENFWTQLTHCILTMPLFSAM